MTLKSLPDLTILNQFFASEKWHEGVWNNLGSILKTTIEEIVMVQKITPDDLPNSELKVDVLLGTDSSGSHKQFAGKDIDIDSSNLEYGKKDIICLNHLPTYFLAK